MGVSAVIVVPTPDPAAIVADDVPFGPDTGAYRVSRGADFIAIFVGYAMDEVRSRQAFYAAAIPKDFPRVFARSKNDSRGLMILPDTGPEPQGTYESLALRAKSVAVWLPPA
jgi:hypothetical protein